MLPSGRTTSSPRTAVARFPFPTPEPCVAVAIAPATEICGSDAMLCRAQPRFSSATANSPYLMPADTVTIWFSLSITNSCGKFSKVIEIASVSAMALKQWALPLARTFGFVATICANSAVVAGANVCESAKVTVPDQFFIRRSFQ